MAGIGTYNIPNDIMSDEDIWFKYFTKHQLLWLVGGIAVSAIFVYGSITLGINIVPSLALALIIIAFCFAVSRFKMPLSRTRWGGGEVFEELLLRLIYRWTHRVLYVRNYDRKLV